MNKEILNWITEKISEAKSLLNLLNIAYPEDPYTKKNEKIIELYKNIQNYYQHDIKGDKEISKEILKWAKNL